MTSGAVRNLARLAVGLPFALLAVSFVVICLHAGSFSPWNLPVHEDGKRTFLNTVFYFEHAVRELPIDILLGMAAGAGVYLAFPQTATARRPFDGRDRILTAAALAAAGVILGGAAWQGGAPMILDNLFQNHTRPGAPLVWGSHWRYHLLERLPMILTAVGLGALLRAVLGRSHDARGRAGVRMGGAVIGLYLALTVLFTPNLAALMLPFRDPQYLGHEAREIMTHAIVTLPLAFAGCMLLQGAWTTPGSPQPVRLAQLAGPAVLALAAAGLAGYGVLAAVASDAASHGQSADMVTLIFPHFFEHSLGYVLAPFTAAAAYAACRALER